MPDNFDAARVPLGPQLGKVYCVVDGEGTRVSCVCSRREWAESQEQLISGTPGSVHGPYTVVEFDITAALLEARKAPEGHVIDEQGVVRKVCGLLPAMACGSLYAHHSRYDPPVWAIDSTGTVVPAAVSAYARDNMFLPSECYSTREAAEAAKEKA